MVVAQVWDGKDIQELDQLVPCGPSGSYQGQRVVMGATSTRLQL